MAELMRFVRKFDLFRRVDEAYLTSATAYGGTFTLTAYIVMAVLVVFELSAYLSSATSTNVLLDVNQEHELKIHINLTMLALPCNFLSVNVYDSFGWTPQNTQMDYTLTRLHINSKHQYIPGEVYSKDIITTHAYHADDKELKAVEVDEEGHHALDLKGEIGFRAELREHEYTLMNFYSPWCRWCRALAPTYEEAADLFDKKKFDLDKPISAKFASLNCVKYKEICESYNVQAYPTLLIFHRDGPVFPFYKGERTVDKLVQYLMDAIKKERTSLKDIFLDYACRVDG